MGRIVGDRKPSAFPHPANDHHDPHPAPLPSSTSTPHTATPARTHAPSLWPATASTCPAASGTHRPRLPSGHLPGSRRRRRRQDPERRRPLLQGHARLPKTGCRHRERRPAHGRDHARTHLPVYRGRNRQGWVLLEAGCPRARGRGSTNEKSPLAPLPPTCLTQRHSSEASTASGRALGCPTLPTGTDMHPSRRKYRHALTLWSMYTPGPRLARFAYVVPIDPVHRAVLLSHRVGAWTPARTRIQGDGNYESAALKLARQLVPSHIAIHRLALVVGHGWASPPKPGSGSRAEARVLLAITPEASLGRTHPHERWFSQQELLSPQIKVRPSEVVTFIDGYWGGWLPDGRITLDWP